MKGYGRYAMSRSSGRPSSERHWESYHAANRLFADAVLQEAAGQPAVVFVQDYHLGLLPRMLKNADPTLVVAQFWHIPWPNWEAMRVFPWNRELLESMLCNDVLGFHLHSDCENFLATVDRNVNAVVDQSRLSAAEWSYNTCARVSDQHRLRCAFQQGANS